MAYGFHDYKASGIDRERLQGWAARSAGSPAEPRRHDFPASMPDPDKQGLDENKGAGADGGPASMIKRPVLDVDGKLLVGFKPDQYEGAFSR